MLKGGTAGGFVGGDKSGMADRRITGTGKNTDGDIVSVCNHSVWGKATRAEAIRHIETGLHTYFVKQPGTTRSDVHVVDGPSGKYLRSDPDGSASNNLDNLPAC